jgi:hypothetical protein
VKIKSQRDFFSGLIFMAMGIAFAWGASSYGIGESARMGPGYFPVALAVVLLLLGLVLMFKSLVVETEDGEPIVNWAWRPLFFVIAANLAFGVLFGGLPALGVPPMGMIAAIYASTLIASLAGGRFRVRAVLILATLLAAAGYVCLITVLKLQLQVWPAFVGG